MNITNITNYDFIKLNLMFDLNVDFRKLKQFIANT